MKNIKKIIGSALLATAFAVTSVGTTFALFTDEAKTTITVGSGIVNIESGASLVRYQSSVDGTNQAITGNSYSNELVGNNFSLSGSVVTINKMVPGDQLTVKLSALNKSNVRTKTRFLIEHALITGKEDLYPALELSFALSDSSSPASLFKWKSNDPVDADHMAEGVELYKDLLVTITLPDSHNGAITYGSENLDNQYQDKGCSISFTLQAVQGNASTNPIDEINAYLQAEKIVEGQNKTMHDAVIDMGELGFEDLSVLNYNNVNYVYDLANDQFVAENTVTANHHRYFKVYSEMPTPSQTFSIYAANNFSVNEGAVALNGVGFDAGDATGIASVSYAGLGQENARSNIIRTNSLATSVTVNAEYDVVEHYGDAASVNIIAVANSSYHEFGNVAFTEVKKGRIVLESTSKVNQIHIVATNKNPAAAEEAFAPIVIKDNGVALANLPAKITRDTVAVPENTEKLVVTVISAEEVQEEVYVYEYTDTSSETPAATGTTQQTATQNKDVETTLGILVLDDGGEDNKGEKALTETEKVDVKKEVITEAVQAACAHEHTHYEFEMSNLTKHKQICDDCGKVLADNLPHVYDAEHADTCIHCGYNANEIVLNVSSVTALSAAINAYNSNTLPDANYVIELEDGIYIVTPNQYTISQNKINSGKTLTIKAKNMPVDENATFGVTIQSAQVNNPADIDGSSAFFKVSGHSGTNYGGDILFEGIRFDFTTSGLDKGTDLKYNSKRLNAVYLMDGNDNRYAHGVTMDKCQFVGPGGKLACAISANQHNSSPSRITISNCKGSMMNAWFNGYADTHGGAEQFGLKLINLQSENFLVVCNNMGSGSTEIDNVNGGFFYRESGNGTECWLLKSNYTTTLTIKNSSWRLLGNPNQSGSSGNWPGVICVYTAGGPITVTADITNLTIDRSNITVDYFYDVYVKGNASFVLGETTYTAPTKGLFPAPTLSV